MSEKERNTNTMTGTSGTNAGQPPPIYQPQQYYGTFQGIPQPQPQPQYNHHPPPQPVAGFPQPAPPPNPYYYSHAYLTVPGYAVAEGRPVREPRLPCCGVGIGWFLFVSGFFFVAIPWYVGVLILLCVRVDYREKPGLVACTIASVLVVIAVVFGVAKGTDAW